MWDHSKLQVQVWSKSNQCNWTCTRSNSIGLDRQIDWIERDRLYLDLNLKLEQVKFGLELNFWTWWSSTFRSINRMYNHQFSAYRCVCDCNFIYEFLQLMTEFKQSVLLRQITIHLQNHTRQHWFVINDNVRSEIAIDCYSDRSIIAFVDHELTWSLQSLLYLIRDQQV